MVHPDSVMIQVYPVTMTSLTALPALTDNYIWTLTGSAGGAVIVDPGEAAPVLAAVANGLRPCAILITHHHHDHIGAVVELTRRFDLPVYAPEDARIDMASVRVRDGDEIRVSAAALTFQVIAVPGHTLTHVAYAGEGVVFVGDTLFSLGCGRLFEGSPAQMLASLKRLARLPPETLLCCAHEYTLANAAFAQAVEPGNPTLKARIDQARGQRAAGQPSLPTTLAMELATNPFLRWTEAEIQSSVRAFSSGADTDELATFTALRRWKDGFIAS